MAARTANAVGVGTVAQGSAWPRRGSSEGCHPERSEGSSPRGSNQSRARSLAPLGMTSDPSLAMPMRLRVLLALLVFPIGLPAQQPPPRFDAYVKQVMETFTVPGLSVAIVK